MLITGKLVGKHSWNSSQTCRQGPRASQVVSALVARALGEPLQLPGTAASLEKTKTSSNKHASLYGLKKCPCLQLHSFCCCSFLVLLTRRNVALAGSNGRDSGQLRPWPGTLTPGSHPGAWGPALTVGSLPMSSSVAAGQSSGCRREAPGPGPQEALESLFSSEGPGPAALTSSHLPSPPLTLTPQCSL